MAKAIEYYIHHGTTVVAVQSDLRGLHRDHCLCYQDCKYFDPEGVNCTISQAVYQMCVDYDLVLPVWECPKYEYFKGEQE